MLKFQIVTFSKTAFKLGWFYSFIVIGLVFNIACPPVAIGSGRWVEVVDFDPCESPIHGNTNMNFEANLGLYVGYLQNEEWRVKVGYSGGSINEVGASCEAALATNPTLVCPAGNVFFARANGDPFWTCEDSYNKQGPNVHKVTCYQDKTCRHTSDISYNPDGSIAQILNDHWSVNSQQVIQLWKWVGNEENFGPPEQCL